MFKNEKRQFYKKRFKQAGFFFYLVIKGPVITYCLSGDDFNMESLDFKDYRRRDQQ